MTQKYVMIKEPKVFEFEEGKFKKMKLKIDEPCLCGSRCYSDWSSASWSFATNDPSNPKVGSAEWYFYDAEAYRAASEQGQKDPCKKEQTKIWQTMDLLPECYRSGTVFLIGKKTDYRSLKGNEIFEVELAYWEKAGRTRKSKKGLWMHTNHTELDVQDGWTHWMDLPEGLKK